MLYLEVKVLKYIINWNTADILNKPLVWGLKHTILNKNLHVGGISVVSEDVYLSSHFVLLALTRVIADHPSEEQIFQVRRYHRGMKKTNNNRNLWRVPFTL